MLRLLIYMLKNHPKKMSSMCSESLKRNEEILKIKKSQNIVTERENNESIMKCKEEKKIMRETELTPKMWANIKMV